MKKEIRSRRGLIVVLILSLFSSGCVSSYKTVLVSVIDDATGAPVAGAKVTTLYFPISKFSLASKRKSESTTDSSGTAVVAGNYLLPEPALFRIFPDQGFQPAFEISINNHDYAANITTFRTDWPLFDRAPDFAPTVPDLTFRISSKATLAARHAEFEQQKKRDYEQAKDWHQNRPEFWPESRETDVTKPRPAAESALIELRWQGASENVLGSSDDLMGITQLVKLDMNQPKDILVQIRWLSPTQAMVLCRRAFSSGVDQYTYVVSKVDERWTVQARYFDWKALS